MSVNRFTNVVVREQLEAKNIVSASLSTSSLSATTLNATNL